MTFGNCKGEIVRHSLAIAAANHSEDGYANKDQRNDNFDPQRADDHSTSATTNGGLHIRSGRWSSIGRRNWRWLLCETVDSGKDHENKTVKAR